MIHIVQELGTHNRCVPEKFMGIGVPLMLTSGLQSTTITYTQLSLTTASITSRRSNSPADGELSNLISAIKSGNTTDARNSLAELQMVGGAHADSSSPLGTFLVSVSTSLASYNIAGAQNALAVFEASAANRVEPVASSAALSLAPGGRTTPGVTALGEDLLNLYKALDSGDATSAQSAYGSLNNLLESNGGGGDFANQYGNGAESGSLYSLMAQIGAALSTGNLSRVQSTMDTYMRNLSSGSLVSTTA